MMLPTLYLAALTSVAKTQGIGFFLKNLKW